MTPEQRAAIDAQFAKRDWVKSARNRGAFGGVMLLLAGLCLFACGSMAVYRATRVTAEADATVQSVREKRVESRGTAHSEYCPTFAWEHDGRQLTGESDHCALEEGDYPQGATVRVQFDPDDPDRVVPKSFAKKYPDLIVLGVASLIVAAFGLLALRGRRRCLGLARRYGQLPAGARSAGDPSQQSAC